MESDTPRTDKEDWENLDGHREVHADFARQLERELAAAKADLAAAIKQRDEAREGLCRLIALRRKEHGFVSPSDPKAIAAERGWDCFAQQEGGGA